MPGTRSRQGCAECRRRRRKCNEQRPRCGQCAAFDRTCSYPLRLIWGGNAHKYSRSSSGLHEKQFVGNAAIDSSKVNDANDIADQSRELTRTLPRSLPNGIQLPAKYQRLWSYFIDDVLASLSCHPSIHEDLRTGLAPVMIQSPQLMSACLALSAAGFLSRGTLEVDGVEIGSILGHLQTSGLALLRNALGTGESVETLLATCLIWCLTDVFTHRQGMSSWRIHLQGMRALLNGSETFRDMTAPPGSLQSAMRHLYQLYLSLQTLPYIPTLESAEQAAQSVAIPAPSTEWSLLARPEIDGFLGYSNELLGVLQQVDQLSNSDSNSAAEADILLGRLNGMIIRDALATPDISICTSLTADYSHEFALCHQTFQQATLIHLYRRLYSLASGSEPIQAAVHSMEEMVSSMIQGQPCHTWVAMAMPLFTLGCEAYTREQQAYAMDKVNKLEDCIGSLHVKIIRQALEDVWRIRKDLGDWEGKLCASELLGKLQYNIILF